GTHLKPRHIQHVFTFRSFTTQFLWPRACTWPFPLRAPVSTVANSTSHTGPAHLRDQPRLSIQVFDKVRPAKPRCLAGPRQRVERAHAGGARKCGDHAQKHSGLFPQPNSFSQTPSATSRAEIDGSPRAKE